MIDTTREEQFWHAVLERDSSMDGRFFYAVRSTGIFCRPSCPSRRPSRAQVRFFEQASAAEQAGFRACLRCRPAGAGQPSPQAELAQRACQIIDELPDAPPTLEQLGERIGVSPFHLQRSFKQAMGITPRQYAAARRLDRLKARLKEGDTVTHALYEAGYGSSSQLYSSSPAQLGMTPATYRRGGAGAQIRYTVASTPLGQLLVAATERGVCFVALAEAQAELEAALAREFPAATACERDDSALGPWVSAIVRRVNGDPAALDLPLDVQATAFQARVWQALLAIPYGSTRSYGEVAAGLGQPTAARAVARACATNPVALVVPCHRVVGEGGELRGYRWGIERKQALLEQEAQDRKTLQEP